MRRPLVIWSLVIIAICVVAALLPSAFPPRAFPVKVTAYAMTKGQKESMSRSQVRPSERKLTVLWNQTFELHLDAPLSITHSTGSHTIRFDLTPSRLPGGKSIHMERRTESFGSAEIRNPVSSSFLGSPRAWRSFYGVIPADAMTPAETVGRAPDQTETLYSFEGVDVGLVRRLLGSR